MRTRSRRALAWIMIAVGVSCLLVGSAASADQSVPATLAAALRAPALDYNSSGARHPTS